MEVVKKGIVETDVCIIGTEGICIMNKWEFTRYLIDAKKCVDSVLYIAENGEQLRYIDLRKKIADKRRDFYISCCVVLDNHITNAGLKKRALCNGDEIVQAIYYERDKNSAHKDDNYKAKHYSSISEVADDMKIQLQYIRSVCADSLPTEVTLDFVSHDRELFRALHRITADEEDAIYKRKYPFRNTVNANSIEGTKTYRIFQDTEDLRGIPDECKSEYAVVMDNGLCFNEGVQTRQDACIRLNVLYGQNIWCSVNQKELETIQERTRFRCFDEYGIPQPPSTDPILMARIMKILNNK